MVTLPRRTTSAPAGGRYAGLGLTDLPFSTNPVLNPYSTDPRNNGAIYALAPVQEAIDKFERLLFPRDDFHNRVRIASLWSAGRCAAGARQGENCYVAVFPAAD